MKKLNFLSIASVGSRKRPFSYRSRINPVLIPYRTRIDPVSFSYRSPIILASGSGNNTETIRKQYEVDICWKGGRYVVGTWRKRGRCQDREKISRACQTSIEGWCCRSLSRCRPWRRSRFLCSAAGVVASFCLLPQRCISHRWGSRRRGMWWRNREIGSGWRRTSREPCLSAKIRLFVKLHYVVCSFCGKLHWCECDFG